MYASILEENSATPIHTTKLEHSKLDHWPTINGFEILRYMEKN